MTSRRPRSVSIATCSPPARADAIEMGVPSRASPCDVDVPGAADDAPGVQCQPADDDEVRARLGQAAQQLIESWLAQLLSAEPVNRISLWLSAMPSARLTPSGRRASSRRRCTRTASALAAADDAGFRRSVTGGMLTALVGRGSESDLSTNRGRRCTFPGLCPSPFSLPSTKTNAR